MKLLVKKSVKLFNFVSLNMMLCLEKDHVLHRFFPIIELLGVNFVNDLVESSLFACILKAAKSKHVQISK